MCPQGLKSGVRRVKPEESGDNGWWIQRVEVGLVLRVRGQRSQGAKTAGEEL